MARAVTIGLRITLEFYAADGPLQVGSIYAGRIWATPRTLQGASATSAVRPGRQYQLGCFTAPPRDRRELAVSGTPVPELFSALSLCLAHSLFRRRR
jgi:hypothetical protein